MIVLTWNCRGAAKKRFKSIMKTLSSKYKVEMVVLLEPRVSGSGANTIISSLGYGNSIFEDAVGFVGGIWILWNDLNFSVELVEKNSQAILTRIKPHNSQPFLFSAIYANPRVEKRSELWEVLKRWQHEFDEPWLVAGDFNEILSADEKKGGAPVDMGRCRSFASVLDECVSSWILVAQGLFSPGRGQMVQVLPRSNSDHNPLLIVLSPVNQEWEDRPFRFFPPWLEHPGFKIMLEEEWRKSGGTMSNLMGLIPTLRHWNINTFRNIHKKKMTLLRRLDGIQRNLERGHNPFLENLEIELSLELDLTLDMEEQLWFQKSRANWIRDGDRNTRYYHTIAVARRRKNKVLSLKNEMGIWIRSEDALKSLASNYYSNLFADDQPVRTWLSTQVNWPSLDPADCHLLSKPITREEIKVAFFQMGPHKAPGNDGFPAIFYHRNWDLIADQVCNDITGFFNNPEGIKSVNDTLLVLIPKVDIPEKIDQMRPIALCNVLYKATTKIIVNRLKGVMDKLVSPFQTSFVPGRVIHDNIIIAQEMTHSMNRLAGKKAYMSIKIDLAKTYDRLNWNFIYQVLLEAGIPLDMAEVIRACITSPRFQVLWNSSRSDPFYPSRGIRQGDPISPYLFVMCMDKLSHLIAGAVRAKRWKPMRASRKAPFISHLMFADNLVLFGEASLVQLDVMLETLKKICDMSGQVVSIEKTVVYFSKNTTSEVKELLTQASGFKAADSLGKYLGSFLYHGRGRSTLAKSVISSIPTFHMQHGSIPLSVCNEIEKLQRGFIWGDCVERKKVHLIAWNKLCKPGWVGGLGLHNLKVHNEAFLFKIAWQILNNNNALWVRLLLGKYGRKFDVRRSSSSQPYDSVMWRALCSIWDRFLGCLQWKIGNGRDVYFWKDSWLHSIPTISEFCTSSLSPAALEAKFADMVDLNIGDWQLDIPQSMLPKDVVDQIRSVIPPTLSSETDRLVWKSNTNKRSIVKHAYTSLMGFEYINRDPIWGSIWRWQGPQRFRQFTWLIFHGRILTREVTAAWGGSPFCHVCLDKVENIMHVLHDCKKALPVWNFWFAGNIPCDFLSLPQEEWIRKNVDKGWTHSQLLPWQDLFNTTVWFLWNWRNKETHEANFCRPINVPLFITNYIMEYKSAAVSNAPSSFLPQPRCRVKWKPPPSGWWKLNVDAALRRNPCQAACGGLIRDEYGNWVSGFVYNIGSCDPLTAEFWGILKGLQFAWEMKVQNLIVESDSLQAIQAIVGKREDNACYALSNTIQRLLDKDWHTVLLHVRREGNLCADWIAKFAFNVHDRFLVLGSIPSGLGPLLEGGVCVS
ncbi:uncharacterized protein LOC133295534 [Gastrolobium bilobum]|uniref:uncharacterized protein LOC133295534 n=1 Tax=Gastrolobium bilobum TaxID=150636 RepID=UPI002AB1706B|nr:uncharacterized protein LOC133295534 [Gastrolobium bilobum]